MGDVIALPRPRTPADTGVDLPPCVRAWPGQCHAGTTHRCWTWSGWPHICRCTRCELGARP